MSSISPNFSPSYFHLERRRWAFRVSGITFQSGEEWSVKSNLRNTRPPIHSFRGCNYANDRSFSDLYPSACLDAHLPAGNPAFWFCSLHNIGDAALKRWSAHLYGFSCHSFSFALFAFVVHLLSVQHLPISQSAPLLRHPLSSSSSFLLPHLLFLSLSHALPSDHSFQDQASISDLAVASAQRFSLRWNVLSHKSRNGGLDSTGSCCGNMCQWVSMPSCHCVVLLHTSEKFPTCLCAIQAAVSPVGVHCLFCLFSSSLLFVPLLCCLFLSCREPFTAATRGVWLKLQVVQPSLLSCWGSKSIESYKYRCVLVARLKNTLHI